MNVNLSGIWTMIAGTVIAVVYMFTNFVTMAQFSDLKLDLDYDSYYEMLDRHAHAIEQGHDALAAEYSRRLERIKARICESDPEWERCSGTAQ